MKETVITVYLYALKLNECYHKLSKEKQNYCLPDAFTLFFFQTLN